MTQPKTTKTNELHDLGYKIFLDRYAQKDMTRETLAVGDIVIVVVNPQTGQREIGTVTAMNLPNVTIKLNDGETVERDLEHVDKPLETEPGQMMDRVAKGIAAVEKDDATRQQWASEFRWLLDDWKFVPGGRILTAAGTDQELTFYNCLPPEQEILTSEGYKPIADVQIGDLVVTHKNRLRKILHKFERETEEPLYIIKSNTVNYGALRLTGEHKVLTIPANTVDDLTTEGLFLNQEPQWLPAQDLRTGDYLAIVENTEADNAVVMNQIAVLEMELASGSTNYTLPYSMPSIGVQDNLRWVRIDSIATEDYSGLVLDIEVEEDHSFVSAGLVVSNCYVIPSPNDSREGIMTTLTQMTEIMSRGGGVGINISSLRPRHAYVKGVNGRSSGSVSWGALYSFVTGLIEQGGSRRGALMLILNDWHPDVFDFINSKRQMGQITNANISVGISDTLMEAVKNDGDWELVFPDTSDPAYDELWDGDLESWTAAGHKVVHYKTVKAREVWDAVIESAWASAEPGVWFRERSNKMANSWYFNPLISTNPCTTGDTLVATEFGYTKARELEVGMKIRTPAGLKPIEKVYNNGVQKIWRVEFTDGGHLECTADHKLKVVRDKKFEWVAVQDLRDGDKVQVMANEAFGSRRRLPEDAVKYIEKRQLNVPDFFDRNLGFLMGVVTGDDTLRQVPNRGSHGYQCRVAFGAHEQEWLTIFQDQLTDMGIHSHVTLQSKNIPQPDGTVIAHQAINLECYKLATLLVKLGMPTNVESPEKKIAEEFLTLDREFIAGLLDGLFSTDGGVDMNHSNPMLRFHTSSYELAQQVRLMLLQFGIHGRIYTSERDKDLTYDGRNMYGTGIKYDVVIMNEGIPRFYSQIGLSHPEKSAKVKDIAENYYFMGGTWLASIVSVTDTGREEEVYDVYEPETVTWITNGYVSFDCGEQPLGAWSVCNLGALNLANFYDDENHDVDWKKLDKAVRVATRFLDNVIDSTPYFFDENYQMQSSERRVGLGTMGIAELMIYCGVRYGSEESVEFIDKVYKAIAVSAYETSIEIAAEKGAFPKFDAEKLLESGFMQQMPEHVIEGIKKNGLRNVTLLTQAPTGTTGTMVNTSTGIEPFFSWVYYRKSRLGLHEEKVPVVARYFEENPTESELPEYFVTAMDLAPEEHVKVQGAFQKWIDSAISKTCNVPNDYTVEQVSDLYKMMYDLGCKGGTIYRDGSRSEQVLMLKGDERAESEMEEVKGKKDAKEEKPEQVTTPHRVYPRPSVLNGTTVRFNTPFGKSYITMNSDEFSNPFEVFITVGKAGSDIQADAEALGRMISLQLRTTAPQNRREMLKLVVEQLQDIGGARPVGFGPNRILSLPDAVGRALMTHYFTEEQPKQLGLPINGGIIAPAQVETKKEEIFEEASGYVSGADMCPECGTISLIRTEGCRKCLTCGYSEC